METEYSLGYRPLVKWQCTQQKNAAFRVLFNTAPLIQNEVSRGLKCEIAECPEEELTKGGGNRSVLNNYYLKAKDEAQDGKSKTHSDACPSFLVTKDMSGKFFSLEKIQKN